MRGLRRLVYESGEWEVDLARRELRVRGAPVPIGGRTFEIIEVLVQSAGELVTKNDLMGRVWPGAIVEDDTLQFHISAIRDPQGAWLRSRDVENSVWSWLSPLRKLEAIIHWLQKAACPGDPPSTHCTSLVSDNGPVACFSAPGRQERD